MPSVLITGASRGIGRCTAFTFAEAGWDLILLSRDEASLQSLATELASTGQRIVHGAVDLTKPEEIAPGVATLLGQGLTPSVLINNAGAAWTGELLEMPLDRWNWLMQLNLTSVFQMCAAVVPAMRPQGGLVINISSHAARNAFPNWGAYCTVKAALASFTRCLAEEERAHGIRACTLTLGAVDTSLWDSPTVQSTFDRRAMLPVEQAAVTLLHLAQQPSTQIIEDLTLMPATGAF
ncbi:SDR family oxidoreductase [Synechococcus sp. ROS8604]|uniref:SDR family oxidoreductase n=1 Tax=Synechococcus sp. ROS8604 TaxID=1442557 RepID=UPI001644F4EC|nr:SDR family oxidoreductase [Synechococcus sp. ROS8604]QNI89269.1 beta-ketoacyl-(acyl-carrier-protein) reductase protein family [Synechococcus sp. ROS8604]